MFVLLNKNKYYNKIKKDSSFKSYLLKVYGDLAVDKYFMGNDSLFVYLMEDKIVASVRINVRTDLELYGIKYEKIYQIRNLYVDIESRGKGYCKILVKYFIGALKSRNMPIVLDVLPDNIPAVKCYLSNKFVEIGKREIDGVLHTTMILKLK
jgi:ribosomal protein S18 acetylase RimI-like enzyme